MAKKNLETLFAVSKEREKQHKQTHEFQEKAIEKAYEAQQNWNATHNDLIRKMENFVTRTELWTLIAVVVSLIGLYFISK